MTSWVIKNIRTIRMDKNYTQEYMSIVLQISQSYYGRIENGKCKMDLDLFFKIAELLDINIEILLSKNGKSIKERKIKATNVSQKLIDQYEQRIWDLKQEILEIKVKLYKFENQL